MNKVDSHDFKQNDIIFILDNSKSKIIYVRRIKNINYNGGILDNLSRSYKYDNIIKANFSNLRKMNNDSIDKKRIVRKMLNFKKYKDENDIKTKIKEIVLSKFKEENVDIEEISIGTFNVIIRFPELTISNEAGLTHRLRNLYIKLTFHIDNRNIRMYNMKGMRTHLSKVEIENQYLHSHLNWYKEDKIQYLPFCIGEGEFADIYNSLQEHSSNLINFFEKFEYFILALENFLSWESTEGGPYRLISSLSKYKPIEYTNEAPYNEIVYTNLKNKFIFKLKTEDIRLQPFIYENDFFLKIDKDSIDKFVSDKVPLDIFKIDGSLFMFQNNEEALSVNKPYIYEYYFKKMRLRTKIIKHKYDGIEFTDEHKTHSPKYTKKLYQEINEYFINFQIINE